MVHIDWSRQRWRKSRRSNTAHGCVECAITSDAVAIRDSKDPDGTILTFDHDAWSAFIAAVKDGEFDGPGDR